MKITFIFPGLLVLCLPLAAQGPAQAVRSASEPVNIPQPGLMSSSAGQFQGSVANGQASTNAIALSLQDAIDRGMKTNLGSAGAKHR